MEEKVENLKRLVIVVGQDKDGETEGGAGFRGKAKSRYRQSINVCVNASTDWSRSSHAPTADLFNITEDSVEAPNASSSMTRSKRTSITGTALGGNTTPSFNVWKEKAQLQVEPLVELQHLLFHSLVLTTIESI
jgi:hypothetical protein